MYEAPTSIIAQFGLEELSDDETNVILGAMDDPG
jgi:hypothetical protein